MKRILLILSILSGMIHALETVQVKINQPGFPIIPYWQEVFIGIPANADVKVFSDNKKLVGSYKPNILGPEKAKGIEFELQILSKFDGYFPKKNVKLSSIKSINGIPSSKIEIFPFSIQDDQLFITKNISVQITWNIVIQGSSAKFAFLENTDVEKPTIIATVNDQQFFRNNYLNTNPSIQFTVYAKNGIDYRSDSIFYWINNNISELQSDISGSGNSINIIINPTFTNLDSTLSVLVQDAAGNSSDTLPLSFIVSEKLDLIDYGNYPNPFAESTIFAYELTDAVEKITFTIYTVEGRKIRRLDNNDIISGANINLPGYH